MSVSPEVGDRGRRLGRTAVLFAVAIAAGGAVGMLVGLLIAR